MNDDNPHPSNGSAKKKWFNRIWQFFQDEPKSREELVEVIQDAEMRDVIDRDTKQMIEGVLEVSDLKVRDVMIPRSQMITLDIEQSIEECLPTIIEFGHSRFPVINEDKDHIEGVLLAKELLQYVYKNSETPPELNSLIRTAVVVPESKRVDKLLKEFRSERYHMALVVDEFGGVSGLVTIEDILEEIVGDIEDEFDEEDSQADIRKVSKHTYTVNALTEIDDFNDFFHTNFDDSEADTMGGLIVHAFGHLPSQGETVELDGYHFRVSSADKRRLLQVIVKVPEPLELTSE